MFYLALNKLRNCNFLPWVNIRDWHAFTMFIAKGLNTYCPVVLQTPLSSIASSYSMAQSLVLRTPIYSTSQGSLSDSNTLSQNRLVSVSQILFLCEIKTKLLWGLYWMTLQSNQYIVRMGHQLTFLLIHPILTHNVSLYINKTVHSHASVCR